MRNNSMNRIRESIGKECANVHGIVAYKNDKKVIEEYFHDARAEEAVHTFSVAKSITAILVGIAIDQGYLEGVHQRVIEFFPEYRYRFLRKQQQLKEVTIENFLTMTVPYVFQSDPWNRFGLAKDWGSKILEYVGGNEEIGERFHYTSLGLQVLANVLEKATGMRLKEFATKNLFEPLGIQDVPEVKLCGRGAIENFCMSRDIRGWATDPSGHIITGWGLSLTTDEFAKIGLMVLQKGLYHGKRILSEEYIDQMLTPRVDTYGYLWRIYKKDDMIKYDTYCMRGKNGSLVALLPEVDMVVCITCYGTNSQKPAIGWIHEYIEQFLAP